MIISYTFYIVMIVRKFTINSNRIWDCFIFGEVEETVSTKLVRYGMTKISTKFKKIWEWIFPKSLDFNVIKRLLNLLSIKFCLHLIFCVLWCKYFIFNDKQKYEYLNIRVGIYYTLIVYKKCIQITFFWSNSFAFL